MEQVYPMRKQFYISPPEVNYYFNTTVKDMHTHNESLTSYESITMLDFLGQKERALKRAEKFAPTVFSYTIVKIELARYEII